MRSLVTGGSGFVGGHLVRALLEDGDEVRCLVRESSPRDNLAGLPVELASGDLTCAGSVRDAVRGVDRVFHCAADYRLWVPDPERMFATNVDGTRNVLAAAAAEGVGRVVYTSTVGTLGHVSGGAADEDTPVDESEMVGAYKLSKFRAERVAEEWARRGLPVVIVNPSAPVGEADVKPTATGQMIVDFLAGKMTAYVDTGLNLVDVHDVARGHVLAWEKGRPGARYILGNRNLTLKEILDLLASITGRRAPRVRLPHWVPLAVSTVDTWFARSLGTTPRLPLDAVRLARKRMFFDPSRARRELGLPASPVRDALARAVTWFRDRDASGRAA